MEFIWNDGGRAACGFVGTTGDCVTRAIAIASGRVYRDVYDALGKQSLKTPRNGVQTRIAAAFLADLGWDRTDGLCYAFSPSLLPMGAVIVHLTDRHSRSGHFCAVIDQVVHDTWNAADEDAYVIADYWTSVATHSDDRLPINGSNRPVNKEQELTQNEFDKILRRLRALDNTASNNASTEGEKHNALRMMQNLMLTHNLTRDDITGDDNVESVHFSRVACPVNGRRACAWENHLAWYVTNEIFPTVQWYRGTRQHRTFFWFYGPMSDVQNSIALFRELLLTIATSAQLQYGGHTRGSGASYAEGYVAGLPQTSGGQTQDQRSVSEGALIQSRALALSNAARKWLRTECNIRLTSGSGSGRSLNDPAAKSRGEQHGAKHEITASGSPKRITQA